MITTTEYTCSICEDTFTLQTGEFPDESPEGEVLCDDCLCDNYHYTCAWCGDCEDIEEQDRAVVVWDAAAAGVTLPGLYLVRETPYCWTGILEGGLIPRAVEWQGWLPPSAWHDDPYPCGHLCRSCLHTFLSRCKLTALQGMWAALGGGMT
jgi:hypothetical protein